MYCVCVRDCVCACVCVHACVGAFAFVCVNVFLCLFCLFYVLSIFLFVSKVWSTNGIQSELQSWCCWRGFPPVLSPLMRFHHRDFTHRFRLPLRFTTHTHTDWRLCSSDQWKSGLARNALSLRASERNERFISYYEEHSWILMYHGLFIYLFIFNLFLKNYNYNQTCTLSKQTNKQKTKRKRQRNSDKLKS